MPSGWYFGDPWTFSRGRSSIRRWSTDRGRSAARTQLALQVEVGILTLDPVSSSSLMDARSIPLPVMLDRKT